MNYKKIIEVYFEKWLKEEPLELGKLKVHVRHEKIIKQDHNQIILVVENNEDVPYRDDSIIEVFYDSFISYMNTIGLSAGSWLLDQSLIKNELFDVSTDSTYDYFIPQWFVNTMKKVGKEKHEFEWDGFLFSYRLTSVELDSIYNDEFNLSGIIYDMSLKKNGKEFNDIQIEGFLKDIYQKEQFFEFESEVFWPIKEIFYDYPSFFNGDIDYFQVTPDFFDSKGKKINYWD